MECTFKPYEGKNKFIFVSYSHSDSERIAPILEQLNQAGFRIWYDEGIEWGSEWPESIASHLRDCEVCIAFHSRSSVVSPNCRQEINYALKMKKNILSVYLEKVELSDGMDMQLTSFQSTFPYQYKAREEFYNRLIDTKIIQGCKANITVIEKEEENSFSKQIYDEPEQKVKCSFDAEIKAHFKELFGVRKNKDSEEDKESELIKKIKKLKVDKYISFLSEKINNKEDKINYFNDAISLVPPERKERNLKYGSSTWEGINFTLPDNPSCKRLVFQIEVNIDYQTLTKYCTCSLLDSFTQTIDEVDSVTTYFIDFLGPEREGLLFLDFDGDKKEVFLYTGLIGENTIAISKQPKLFTFEEVKSHFRLSDATYDTSKLSETELSEIRDENDGKERWYEADIDENVPIVIDPETALLMKREIYFDEKEKKLKARIKLIPNKSYFVFLALFKDDSTGMSTAVRSLSDIEIAEYYKAGIYGFPKDIIKAVSYFEKDGSAQSLYEIAVLFRSEKQIYDEESYKYYMNLAIEKGCDQAKVEYILFMCLSSDEIDKERAILLLQSIETEKGIRDFVYGYLIEKGYLTGSVDDAYEFYIKSAINGYTPACARLGSKDITAGTLELKDMFIDNLYRKNEILSYCMGCIFYYGLDILPLKEKGIRFLEEAAKEGNVLAINSLFNIYNDDNEFMDDSKALDCLKVLAKGDETLSIELAKRLWNGIGCDVNEENDRIAFEVLHIMVNTDNEQILHNLGWACKIGRGCKIDYDMAKKFFESAEMAESYFYLGDMYEHGLGVQIDIDEAEKCYKKGAQKGCKEAEKRLKELRKTTTNLHEKTI